MQSISTAAALSSFAIRAIASFREALRLNPNHAKSLDRLARVLAAAPDAALRDGAEAMRLATRAAELTGGRQPAVLDALAMAFAEASPYPDPNDLLVDMFAE